MVTLDTDFSDGDFLTAGVITSTSSMNGITTTINSNTLIKLEYVGSDTENSIASSTSETTLATVLISENTVTTGIIVTASIAVNGVANEGNFKLKIGATGSEAQKQNIRLAHSEANSLVTGGSMLFYDSTQNWANDVTVLVTAANTVDGATNRSTCYQLVVTGF